MVGAAPFYGKRSVGVASAGYALIRTRLFACSGIAGGGVEVRIKFIIGIPIL